MNKIQLRFLLWGSSSCLLPLSGCQPAPFVGVFLRNVSASPVVVWLTGPGEIVGGVFRLPGQYRQGHYRNTLLYAPNLVQPTLKSVDRMHDSLAVSGTGPTMKFTVPAHATVWLGPYNRWGERAFRPELKNSSQSKARMSNVGNDVARPELKLQRADSVISILNEAALAKVAHTNFVGGYRRLWFDI